MRLEDLRFVFLGLHELYGRGSGKQRNHQRRRGEKPHCRLMVHPNAFVSGSGTGSPASSASKAFCRSGDWTFEASSEKHPDIVHAKVDTEAEQELAAAAQIQSIPTLMAFKKGKLLFNQPGALPPAALEDLVQQVKAFDVDAAAAESAE